MKRLTSFNKSGYIYNLDPDPKNLDPEKTGINRGLKNMYDFR